MNDHPQMFDRDWFAQRELAANRDAGVDRTTRGGVSGGHARPHRGGSLLARGGWRLGFESPLPFLSHPEITMTKTAPVTPPSAATAPPDPWATAPPSWLTHSSDPAARQGQMKPLLWQHVRPPDRGLVAELARDVLTSQPAVSRAVFARVLLERISALAIRTPAERARLDGLGITLSQQLHRMHDLFDRVRALPAKEGK